MRHQTIVIGGGAAGIFAAIVAKDFGQDVAILEGGSRVGRKLISTGNGRCNITNRRIAPPYKQYHSLTNPDFYRSALDQLTVDDTIEYFSFLGLPIVEQTKGRMYPQNLQASSVVDILRLNLEERNVPVYLETKVIDIVVDENGEFILHTTGAFPVFKAQKVIVATGGVSAPETGSDGSIYPILKKLGHRITPLLPTIVQLKLDYPHLKSVAGVRFDALAKVSVDGEIKRTDLDEVLFTPYGISGPAIYTICREASLGIFYQKRVLIHLDLFPNQSAKELADQLDNHFAISSHRTLFNALNGVLHKRLIPALVKDARLPSIHLPVSKLSYYDRQRLYGLLKNWTFTCVDTNGFQAAQATIGGVDTRDVDPDTLESKKIKHLYFCGEVLDVDGDCGGYNLQWAWSSAYVAGKA